MRYLGIDYGEAKVGLALSEGILSEPYRVVRYEKLEDLKEKIGGIIKKEGVEKIVIGVSEGRSEERAREFGGFLQSLGVEIVFFDETLSTAKAQELSREAGIGRKKRRSLEDAFAASVMLQSFLDSHV